MTVAVVEMGFLEQFSLKYTIVNQNATQLPS